MPLLSFSVDAYDKARARLRELAASRKAGAEDMDSPNKADLDLSDSEEQEEAKAENVRCVCYQLFEMYLHSRNIHVVRFPC
jgi:hypothetical protein